MTDNTIVSAPAGFFQADQVNNDTAADLTSAVLAAQANIDGAITAETNAAASASAAAASASAALGAQSSATSSATAATSAASSASASASTATTQAAAAGTSASTASTAATNAANSATAAATSATNAATSSTSASTSATTATTQAGNASSSATAAAGSASSATTSATSATSSASAASTSASSASTSATSASTSATNAAASATTATTQAGNASTSATAAASSATAAASSATTASTAATNAAASAALAAASIAGNIGRNFLHNPLFTIQQRGTGPFTTNAAYTADRWELLLTTDTNSVSVATLTDTDRSAIGDEQAEFALQHAFTGASSSNAASAVVQPMEDVKRLSGKHINISFWARTTSGTPKVGVSVVQNFGSGGSANVVTGVGLVTLTSSWARYGLTVLVPSASGKTFGTAGTDYTQVALVGSDFSNTYGTGVGVQTGTIQYWGVQVEDASIAGAGNASPLEKRDPGLELTLCQRFFVYLNGCIIFAASAPASGTVLNDFTYPVTMRAVPTGTFDSKVLTNANTMILNAASITNVQVKATAATAGAAFGTFNIGMSADF